MLTRSLPERHVSEFAADVRDSLTKAGQRELPSKYLYDEVGSALFETICVLPEYGLTRADARLLKRFAGEIVDRLPSPVQVAELGSGSGKKTRWILEALSRRQKTYYYPIEISPSALEACAKELGQIDLVSIVGHIWKGCGTWPRGAEKTITCWYFSWAARSAISTAMRRKSLCGAFVRFCVPATRCCWGRTWKRAWSFNCWLMMIRRE
jgi:Histidine-specific methyltransferase, SAM-dependent